MLITRDHPAVIGHIFVENCHFFIFHLHLMPALISKVVLSTISNGSGAIGKGVGCCT